MGVGRLEAGVFETSVRVYYEDTDVGGVVYHANYLKYFERARSDLLRAVGVDQRALRRETGGGFVVRRAEVDFRAPARFDDLLTIRTRALKIGAASATLEQISLRVEPDQAETVLAAGRIVVAYVDGRARAARMPPSARAGLAAAVDGLVSVSTDP